MNRNFLKEAIADAKTVKESAIANAKIALEESFAPRIQSMLSAKLEEMDNEGLEEEMDAKEKEADKKDSGKMEEAKLKGSDMRHGEDEDGEPEEGALKATERDRKIKEEDDKELEEILAELDKELSEKDDSEDVKKENINEDEATDEEEEGYLDGEEDADEDMDEDEDVDLEDMSEEDLKKFIEDVIEDMVGAGELEAGESFEDDVDVDVDEDGEVEVEDDMETSVDVELDEAKDKDDKKSGYDAKLGDSITKRKPADGSTIKQREADSENAEKGLGKRKYSGDKSMDKKNEEINEVKKELKEAYEAVNTLKTELNEINLLNAKLLYTNKIFKSKNLTEAQKVKVLESFDKATTVKEAKLVYETVNSGLKTKKTYVNENLGRASKSAGMAVRKTTKQPIVESNEMVMRFQKLAGIINS
jgi:hypothetical protein